jgi:hypothetical protein
MPEADDHDEGSEEEEPRGPQHVAQELGAGEALAVGLGHAAGPVREGHERDAEDEEAMTLPRSRNLKSTGLTHNFPVDPAGLTENPY